MSARSVPSSGPGRDAIDIEAYVRGFGRRRPDVRIAVPRFADVIGPTVVTPLTRYFALSPVVPMVLGRDARLQLVHEQDAVGVLEHLAVGDFSGTVNVGGRRRHHARAGHPPGRPDPARRCRRSAWTGCPGRCGPCDWAGSRPARSSCCPPAGCWTPPGWSSGSATHPRFSTIEAFDDFAAALRPALAASTVRHRRGPGGGGCRHVGAADRRRTAPRRRPGLHQPARNRSSRRRKVARSGPIPSPTRWPPMNWAFSTSNGSAVRGWSASPARRPARPAAGGPDERRPRPAVRTAPSGRQGRLEPRTDVPSTVEHFTNEHGIVGHCTFKRSADPAGCRTGPGQPAGHRPPDAARPVRCLRRRPPRPGGSAAWPARWPSSGGG